jgi:hypothetical protein
LQEVTELLNLKEGINLQNEGFLVRIYAASLFSKVWVAALQVIRLRPNIDPSFSDRFSPLQIEYIKYLK